MGIRVLNEKGKEQFDKADAIVILLDFSQVKKTGLKESLPPMEAKLKTKIADYAAIRMKKPALGSKLSFDVSPKQKLILKLVSSQGSAFSKLEKSRKLLSIAMGSHAKNVLVDLRGVNSLDWTDALVSAFSACIFEAPRYRKEPKKESPDKILNLMVISQVLKETKEIAERAERKAQGTNLVRRLSIMAGNDLTTDKYVELAIRLAKEAGLKTEFLDCAKLEKLGAGAFCAVARGSRSKSGVLKIEYVPESAPIQKIAFVGKGVTYDTGGAQLKTGDHMFGMHGDMAGSAVALALVLWARDEKVPFSVTAYLAITDNQFSPESYRPNDVVTSLSGKTIEVIDTDAEGRMILSDTLTLASRDKHDLIMDFATLTGSCVRAIGTNYSGGYSNRKQLLKLIQKAGNASGERVWPFPNDGDYGRCLKSKVADLKQCRLKGGVDHIEASYFLRQFVDKKIPYVHVDLSAIENDGGLGHVPSENTGFGVRFATEFVDQFLNGKKKSEATDVHL